MESVPQFEAAGEATKRRTLRLEMRGVDPQRIFWGRLF